MLRRRWVKVVLLVVLLLAACATGPVIWYVRYLRAPSQQPAPSFPDGVRLSWGRHPLHVELEGRDAVAAFQKAAFSGEPRPDPRNGWCWKEAQWYFALHDEQGHLVGYVSYFEPDGDDHSGASPEWLETLLQHMQLLFDGRSFIQCRGEKRLFEVTPEWHEWLSSAMEAREAPTAAPPGELTVSH